jgi:hypothetical protein
MGSIMCMIGMCPSDYGDPEETINNVFMNRGTAATPTSGLAALALNRHGDVRPSTPEKTRRRFAHPLTRFVIDEEDEKTPVGSEGGLGEAVSAAARDSSGLFDPFLTKKEFIERALHEPDLLDCFGLFDFFHWRLLEPYEVEARKTLNISPGSHMTGHLQIKKVGLLPRVARTYWVEIKNGFIGIFRHKGVRTLRTCPPAPPLVITRADQQHGFT